MEEEQKCICRRQKNLPIDLIVSYIQFLAVDMCAKLTFEKKRQFSSLSMDSWIQCTTAVYYRVCSSDAEYAGNA